MPTGGFRGGLRLEGRRQAADRPIRRCPLPSRLRIALRQHPGAGAEPVVRVGDLVRAGQRIARGCGPLSADLHAPCRGRVSAIEQGLEGGIELQPDGQDPGDPKGSLEPLDPTTASPDALRARIAEAGIVGLGGGGFPSADKLRPAPAAVLLNGVECEPLIACDNRLLQERAAAVIGGGELLRRACGAAGLRIAIADDMPAARAALEAACATGPPCRIDVLPARYPQGSERQLIEALLGVEVPRGGLPADLGVVVFNVGTAEAVWQSVVAGRPLTHRLVSVAGGGVLQPVVLEAALGTPLADLIAAAGGYRADAARLLLGGPLSGRALAADGHGLCKADHAVVVMAASELPAAPVGLPCIRCGACADVCPARLQPQLLWQFHQAGQTQRQREHGLFDCIECAACDLVCPSRLPLSASFGADKLAQRGEAWQREQAALARQRFELRQQRLERESAERAAERAELQRRRLAQDAVRAALTRAGGVAGKPRP